MAGMLPGVECARRRRCHQSFIAHGGATRRSSFCLYTISSRDNTTHSSISSPRRIFGQETQFEKLDGDVREAKERLDKKLKRHRKSETTRNIVRNQVLESKRLLSYWSKLRGKKVDEEEEECAVCLEKMNKGGGGGGGELLLVKLPCEHKFHSMCLVPWLHSNGHCPCCRMDILS